MRGSSTRKRCAAGFGTPSSEASGCGCSTRTVAPPATGTSGRRATSSRSTPASLREFHLRSRGFGPELFLLAFDGEELAGFALDYPVHGTDTGLGWVATLGVRAPWRRRGLGEALLHASFAALHARGLRRVGLGVDAQNVTGALRLYERVGMRQVRRSDNWQKHL